MLAIVLAQAGGDGGNPIAGFLPLILIVVVFWLLLIRPQQKRAKAQRELVTSLGPNDRIVTVGGLHGTITSVDDDTIRVEVSPGTVFTFAKGAVARRLIDADTGTEFE